MTNHLNDTENSTELLCEEKLATILDILDENEYRYHVLPHSGLMNDWFRSYVELSRAIDDYLELGIVDSYEVPYN